MTTNAPAAQAFCGAAIPWPTQDSGMPGMNYTLSSSAAGRVVGLIAIDGVPSGGVFTETASGPMRHGMYDFVVDDIDVAAARITAHAGRVIVGPHHVSGDDWIVQAYDPQGAAFALAGRASPDRRRRVVRPGPTPPRSVGRERSQTWGCVRSTKAVSARPSASTRS